MAPDEAFRVRLPVSVHLYGVTRPVPVGVTFVVKSCVPDTGTEARVGLTLNKTATAATIVTLAEADLVGSTTLFAVTVTTDDGTLTGATYSPLAEIVPHAAPAQPASLTV